jgi:hypothetical protein
MKPTHTRTDTWLAAIVLAHLALSLVHGAAHAGAHVMLSPSAALFVYVVILAGPIAGLALQRLTASALGAWLIAASMAGALVFGVVNHFVVDSADHVQRVVGPWRGTFGLTAGLLAAIEAAGTFAGVRSARHVDRR